MLREVCILMATAIAFYIWLTAVSAPFVSSIGALARDPLHARAWHASALGVSTVILWTTIAAGIMLLVATLAPVTALAFLESPVRDAALLAGSVVWVVRSVCIGVPRFGSDVEVASALAVVSLFRDDLDTLQSAEALYRERVRAGP